MPRIANLFFTCVVCVTAAMILIAAGQTALRDSTHTGSDESHTVRDASVHVAQSESSASENSAAKTFPIIVRKPIGPPRIELAGTDPQGRSASVACSTCHSVRKPNLENVSAATLDEFHQGMTFEHGKIACYACHNPSDADTLHLADGASVAYEDVMTLCSQCHSKQAESFAHGAHGGMNGHWDLNVGPQMKNNCIDCHDPHAPAYPKMIVGFKPKDRFNEPTDPAEH
ncbi:Doubled CXXCH motif [Rubripirellula tenax]|uniref:Doubled CXXCH motif n=1 Tax=Rubripirellula tenax TaxID=2528015 RepID=A0A5C6EM19_9BACT|nr:cytochrome c3 family protein [Rubripirellula tenax]TWU48656.1 Doubled CXXCH motif [Rubripirellula tenax]